MSVKDLNKTINLYDSLTGELIFSIDFDDFQRYCYADDYFGEKVNDSINKGKEIYVKFGYKS